MKLFFICFYMWIEVKIKYPCPSMYRFRLLSRCNWPMNRRVVKHLNSKAFGDMMCRLTYHEAEIRQEFSQSGSIVSCQYPTSSIWYRQTIICRRPRFKNVFFQPSRRHWSVYDSPLQQGAERNVLRRTA